MDKVVQTIERSVFSLPGFCQTDGLFTWQNLPQMNVVSFLFTFKKGHSWKGDAEKIGLSLRGVKKGWTYPNYPLTAGILPLVVISHPFVDGEIHELDLPFIIPSFGTNISMKFVFLKKEPTQIEPPIDSVLLKGISRKLIYGGDQ